MITSSAKFNSVIITAGISLFNKTNRYRKWIENTGVFEFEWTNPLPCDGDTPDVALEKWRTACQRHDWYGEEGDPMRVSAEFSLLHALQKEGRLSENAQVTLVHTDTLGGCAAALFLEKILARDFGADMRLKKVEDIDTSNRRRLRRSLGGFMSVIADALYGHDPTYTCFAPIGGFKMMTYLAYLAGAYLGFPTAYLHEDDQQLHEVPAVPIRISADELQAIAPILKRIAREDVLEFDELSALEQDLVRKCPYYFERDSDLVSINAFAGFLMDRPQNRHLFATRIYISAEVDKLLTVDQKMSDYCRKEIKSLLTELASPADYKGRLRHDLCFPNLKNASFHLYKGDRNGTLTFSSAYRYDDKKDTLHINRMWTDHNAYERDARSGHGFSDDPDRIRWIEKTDWYCKEKN